MRKEGTATAAHHHFLFLWYCIVYIKHYYSKRNTNWQDVFSKSAMHIYLLFSKSFTAITCRDSMLCRACEIRKMAISQLQQQRGFILLHRCSIPSALCVTTTQGGRTLGEGIDTRVYIAISSLAKGKQTACASLWCFLAIPQDLTLSLSKINKKIFTLISGSVRKQYGWFWYCWISPVISATFLLLLKLIKSFPFLFRKSLFPSSVFRIFVKYIPSKKCSKLFQTGHI